MGQVAFLGQIATHTQRILKQLEAHILDVALIQVDGLEVLCCITLALDQIRYSLGSLVPNRITLQAQADQSLILTSQMG